MLRLLRRKRKNLLPPWHLDTPLLDLGGIPWTWRDAFQSTMVMGSTGAGKSSSSIRSICDAFARGGAGGCCFTVKREDAATYRAAFEQAGRESDLIVFSPANPLRFNFIADEITHSPDASGLAENITGLIMLVSELADRSRRGDGGGSDNAEYFRQAMLRLCRHALLVLILSGREVSVTNLHRLVISSPRSRTEGRDPTWQTGAFFFECLQAAAAKPKNASLHADCELAIAFFMEEWAELSPRTRTTVESTLTSATDALSRGMVRDTLSAGTPNFSPSMLAEGKIVVLDYPVLLYREVGQIIQVVVKACIQRWLSRRDVKTGPRPVFLIADECQHLITAEDERFATTCRSTQTAVVWATQSISTLLEAFGGGSAEPRLHSFLGNAGTQIHHQQTDIRTISYVQELTGRSRQLLINGGQSRSNDWLAPLVGGDNGSTSGGFSESWEHEIQASLLNSLVKGGPPHFFAEAVLYRGGRRFASGRTWSRIAMKQRR